MISSFAFIKTVPSVFLCIFNNLIITFILYHLMKVFLGYKPILKKLSVFLYIIFFILANTLCFKFEISVFYNVPEGYLSLIFYFFIISTIIFIAYCYKPTLSTGLSSALLTFGTIYCAIPIADYIFTFAYKSVVTNLNLFLDITSTMHIIYIIFEKNQQLFIYIIELIIRLIFLFIFVRIKCVYEERNMYYIQASTQQNDNVELKQFRHDIKNHVGALNQMVASNQIDKALEYLATITDISDTSILLCNTENVALDSIVNYKISLAQKQGIICSLQVAIPTDISIADKDIIIILGNLLDNAIEACSRISKEKYITIKITYRCGALFIYITNSYDGLLNKVGAKYITMKKDKLSHGLGMKNVQKALAHYNGTLEVNETSSEFKVSAIMYINQNCKRD